MKLNQTQIEIIEAIYNTDSDLYINQSRQCGLSTAMAIFAVAEAVQGKTVVLLYEKYNLIYNVRSLIDKHLHKYEITNNNVNHLRFRSGGIVKFHTINSVPLRGLKIDYLISENIKFTDLRLNEFIYNISPAMVTKGNERSRVLITETTNNNFCIQEIFKKQIKPNKKKGFIKIK